MNKFNELSKYKKLGLITLLLVLLLIVGFVVGKLNNKQTGEIILNKEDFAGLIKNDYTVESINDLNKELEINIKGDLDKNNVKELALLLNKKNLGSGWEKEKITVNIFGSYSNSFEKTEFYQIGLIYRLVIDTEKANAGISEYVTVPAVEKTDNLVEYSKGDIIDNEGHLIISLNMDVSKDDDDLTEVVQQAKTFTIFFRETNKDKDIKSIELRINPNDSEKKYNFHTEYENVLEVIDVLSF